MQRLQKIILFYFIYLLPFSIVHSQNSKDLNLKIQGANQLMIEKKYSIAKDLWMEIVKQQPNNANTNYKTGLCLLESSNSKLESLKYLKIAAKKISKKESEIDWNETAQKILAKINGLNPYPGVWFNHNGNRIKIIDAEISKNQGKKGEVITNELIVACKDKAIKINYLQKEGKKVLDTKSFLTGYKIFKGEILS